MNNIEASINVLRLAAPSDLLVIVRLEDGVRETRLVRVTKRATGLGRTGGTTITAVDATRDNGKTFEFKVTVSKLPDDVVSAHTVNVPKGPQKAREIKKAKALAAKVRAAKAAATRAAKKAAAVVGSEPAAPTGELLTEVSVSDAAFAVATPENDPSAPAAGDGFAVPASLGGIEPSADATDEFTPGV